MTMSSQLGHVFYSMWIPWQRFVETSVDHPLTWDAEERLKSSLVWEMWSPLSIALLHAIFWKLLCAHSQLADDHPSTWEHKGNLFRPWSDLQWLETHWWPASSKHIQMLSVAGALRRNMRVELLRKCMDVSQIESCRTLSDLLKPHSSLPCSQRHSGHVCKLAHSSVIIIMYSATSLDSLTQSSVDRWSCRNFAMFLFVAICAANIPGAHSTCHNNGQGTLMLQELRADQMLAEAKHNFASALCLRGCLYYVLELPLRRGEPNKFSHTMIWWFE